MNPKKLTEHVDASLLNFHHAGVDLAHVASAIRLLQLSDPELPSAKVVVGDAHAWIVRYHARVQAEDGLVFGSYPSNLK